MAPVKTFVQRPSLRNSIRNQLVKSLEADREGEVKKVGVWGMGGAGKSQLALSYLQRYRTEYDATFWIQADQPGSIDRDFLAIYRLLAETTSSLSDPNPEDVKQSVLGWFARASGQCLVIFDGADSLHQKDKDFVALSEYFPGSPNVHIIITSRTSIAKSMSTFEGVYVGELEESESVKLFLDCAEIQPSRENVVTEAKLIVNELGYLALAISMAGKYVSRTQRLSSNLSAYLEEFRRRRRDLLSKTPEKLVEKYHHSVMAVWEDSYSAVYERLPEACRLLTLLSFIHYDDIFLELFGLGIDPGPTAVASWTSVLGCQNSVDLPHLEECFWILEEYSLCQYQMTQNSYSIHRLVHAWGCDRLQGDGDGVQRFWHAASQLLDDYLKAIGDRQDGPASKLRVVPHLTDNIQSFRRTSTIIDWSQIDLLTLERFGFFFVEIGRWNEAALSQREVLEKRQRILGDEHPGTIMAMNNLASTLSDQGTLDEAALMKREVLEKRQRILGDEHPDTISAMNNLAITLSCQGKLDEAALMMKEVLEKRQRILGDEHPDTIMAMHNIASTLSGQGKLDEAALMMKEVLEKMQQILGDGHPHTIMAMNNLASTLSGQGKLDEAALMKREVLEKRLRILGDEHPDTIMAMHNLASTLSGQGKLDEAALMMKEVLEKVQRILGDGHPHTITAMNNLAITLGDQGKPDEAALMKREVLEKMQQILGDEHPDTISAMSNLAVTLGDQGKLDEAAFMKREVLEKRQRILGDEHPDTISAMGNLASTLYHQGKLDEAAVMMKEVLEKRQRILGDDHPYTTRAAEYLRLIRSALHTGPSDTSTTKKQPFLKRLTGKLRRFRDLSRSPQC
jgi:tetratricopeptide (TPR) repeat protein